ncbi:hypothetical protein DPMN_174474, partial [Dreissena polymorpha]
LRNQDGTHDDEREIITMHKPFVTSRNLDGYVFGNAEEKSYYHLGPFFKARDNLSNS